MILKVGDLVRRVGAPSYVLNDGSDFVNNLEDCHCPECIAELGYCGIIIKYDPDDEYCYDVAWLSDPVEIGCNKPTELAIATIGRRL
jgi:hypothetical protein